jgi:tRNA (guanine10-N2)-dimethyltransferase
MYEMKLIIELSGEHPDLPVAELSAIGTVLERFPQVAVMECERPEDAARLALSHTVMEYLGECDASGDEFSKLLDRLSISTERTFAGRAKKIDGAVTDMSQAEFERTIGSHISGKISLGNPEEEYRVIVSRDRCFFGRVLIRVDRSSYELRRPGDRPFFHPGVMMPRMARALVNISRILPGEWLLDPFCGTGGIILESEMIGVNAVGNDVDCIMVAGTRKNVQGSNVILADSTILPYRDNSFDAVVTDLPYGQSVIIIADNLEHLYTDALTEIRRVLKPGKRAVIVTHRDIRPVAEGIMTIEAFYEQRVHKSLTRRILVLKK